MLRRYLISFTFIIAIPIFVILAVFFRMFETTLVEYLSEQSLEATKQLAQGLDEEAKRIALFTSALANDKELLAHLSAYHRSTTTAETLMASRGIASKLDTVFNYTNQAGAVFFFFTDNDIFYHRNAFLSMNAHSRQAAWYQKVLREKGKTHILQTFSLHEEHPGEGLFISCAIAPGEDALKQGLEVILLSFKSRIYSDLLLRQPQDQLGDLLILNTEQAVIFDKTANQQLKDVLPALTFHDGYQTVTTASGKFMLISNLLPYTGMRMVRVFDYVALTGRIRKYSYYVRGALFGLVLLFCMYTGIFFRSLIRPLRNVILKMQTVGKGDMNVRVETEGIAELNQLGATFNQMVEKIRRLTQQIELKERQRAKAEIEALQCQINPHFLSNTLNAIKMMAGLVGAENIRKMTAALMRILTESFHLDEALIPVEQEITTLEHYVYIMKVRFGDSFEVRFDLPEDVRRLRLLKMLLQPLLENAILHGIRDLERKGDIRITGWREAERLTLEVADNGVGMSEDTLQSLWEARPHPHKGFHCVGIRNVQERLRLNYGDAYGLTIQSERDKGTRVTLVLPLIEEKDDV